MALGDGAAQLSEGRVWVEWACLAEGACQGRGLLGEVCRGHGGGRALTEGACLGGGAESEHWRRAQGGAACGMGVSGRRGGARGGACWGTARPACPSVTLIQPSLAEDGQRQGRGSPAQHPVSSQTEAPLLTQKPLELRSYFCAPSGPCGDAENCAQ